MKTVTCDICGEPVPSFNKSCRVTATLRTFKGDNLDLDIDLDVDKIPVDFCKKCLKEFLVSAILTFEKKKI